jgi:hypothetical protein
LIILCLRIHKVYGVEYHAYHALEARATMAYIIENLLAPKFTSPIPNTTQHASLHACSIDRHLTLYLPGRLLVFLSGCHTTRLMVVDGNGQRQRERLRLSLSGPHFIPRYGGAAAFSCNAHPPSTSSQQPSPFLSFLCICIDSQPLAHSLMLLADPPSGRLRSQII